jgi:hypothetical protein
LQFFDSDNSNDATDGWVGREECFVSGSPGNAASLLWWLTSTAPVAGTRLRNQFWNRRKHHSTRPAANSILVLNFPGALPTVVVKLEEWKTGERMPTFRQLEQFARTTMTPFGALFLNTPSGNNSPSPTSG